MRRALGLVFASACVPSAKVPVELTDDISSVLILLRSEDGTRRLYAVTREVFERDGLPLSIGEDEVMLMLYRSTVEQLLLRPGEVGLPDDGVPIPRPTSGIQFSIREGQVTDQGALDPSTAEIRIPYDRWFDCLGSGRCAVRSPDDPGAPICDVCADFDIDPPVPPLAPTAPAIAGPALATSCPPGQADFAGDDLGCIDVGDCSGWPELPPDAIFVATTLDDALMQALPMQTIAIPAGAWNATTPAVDVKLVGQCPASTVVTLGPASNIGLINLSVGPMMASGAITIENSALLAGLTLEDGDVLIAHSGGPGPVAITDSTATIRDVSITGPIPVGMWFDHSRATIDGLALRLDQPDGGYGIAVVGESNVHGERLAIESQAQEAFHVLSSTASFADVRVQIDFGVIGALGSAVLAQDSSVTIDRIAIHATASEVFCVQGIRSALSVTDLDCYTDFAGGSAALLPLSKAKFARARFDGFYSGIGGDGLRLEIEDVAIQCEEAPEKEYGDAIHVGQNGAFDAHRLSVRDCGGIGVYVGYSTFTGVPSDFTIENCEIGLQFRGIPAQLSRIAILSTDEPVILDFGAGATIEDLFSDSATPDRGAGIAANDGGDLRLSRFELHGGAEGIVFGDGTELLENGLIEGSVVGVAVAEADRLELFRGLFDVKLANVGSLTADPE